MIWLMVLGIQPAIGPVPNSQSFPCPTVLEKQQRPQGMASLFMPMGTSTRRQPVDKRAFSRTCWRIDCGWNALRKTPGHFLSFNWRGRRHRIVMFWHLIKKRQKQNVESVGRVQRLFVFVFARCLHSVDIVFQMHPLFISLNRYMQGDWQDDKAHGHGRRMSWETISLGSKTKYELRRLAKVLQYICIL